MKRQLTSQQRKTLSEAESKTLIKSWGVSVTVVQKASTAEAAVTAAEKIGFPVVLKIDSHDITHKTEIGGVQLNLSSSKAVREAFETIIQQAKRLAPQATLNGVIVENMVQKGVEVIVGLTYDEQMGPTLMFGIGGVMVEVFKDVTLRHCPITLDEAHDMIRSVKGAPLLHGFRGAPACDVKALAHTLVTISHMGVQLDGCLKELDINPLLVLPEGQGVKAVDALATLKE